MKSIIHKYLSGKSSYEEQENLLNWIRKEEHLSDFQREKEEWKGLYAEQPVSPEYQLQWNSVQNKMMETLRRDVKQKQRTLTFFKYAAIVLVVVTVPSLVYFFSGSQSSQPLNYTTVTADFGQISKVVLPDSSVVWVNSGSSVRYNNHFSSTNRDIDLVGEAYFKVTKNKNLPLIVSCSDLKVKVLGTEFSVSDYPEDGQTQVVLEHGRVELTSKTNSSFRQEMKPGELASFHKEKKELTLSTVNTVLYTSWKDGLINIYNLPLKELVIKLEKRYNQKFEVDEDIKNMPYTFTIKNEDLSNVLTLMEKITPVTAIQDKNVIKLKHNKSKLK